MSGTRSGAARLLRFTDGSQRLSTKGATTGDVLTFSSVTQKWSASAASSGSASVNGVLTASEVSAGATYEVVTGLDGSKVLQLKRQKTYTTARTSALTGTEWGRTWMNGASLDSADQNTTTANAFRWDLDATSSDWSTGTQTAPYYYRTVLLNAGDRLTYTVRVSCDGDATHELAGIGVTLDSSQATYSLLRLGYSFTAVSPGVQVDDSVYAVAAVAVTAGQRNAGVWLRMVIDASGIHHYYNTTDQATPPTGAWSRVRTQNVSTSAQWWMGQTLRVCLNAMTVNTSNNFECDFLYEDIQFEAGERGRTGIQWGSVLLDTSATEQLIAEVDFGTNVSLNQTRLRAILADATNTRPGDTATVTYSVVSGASTAPASSTYYAASAVVAPAAGRYIRVYAKILSATGAEQGSVRLPLILPVSA